MNYLKNILRICIFCREKYKQDELLRLRCKDKKIVLYDNYGRSFYICNKCIDKIQKELTKKEYKKFEKLLLKECKESQMNMVQFKEILINVR